MYNWPQFLSPDARINFWMIAVGVVCNSACAIVGCYLVLRRMSLLGDAIGHAVLAGIAFAFLLTGSISFFPIMIGALVVGMLTAFLTQTLTDVGHVPEDSSMGVVFTSLFAVGVLVVSQIKVHIDTDCVLFGAFGQAVIDVVAVWGAGTEGAFYVPAVFAKMLPVLAVTIAFVCLFWKELKIVSFDGQLATSIGVSAVVVHYLLMGVVSLVTVVSLEAVGAIVVVAMLIVPAATAHLLTDRLKWMILSAVGVGCVSAVVGVFAARVFETEVAGMMAVAAGGQFALAVAFAPRHGVVSRVVENVRLAFRIASEDVIAFLYRREEKVRPGDALAAATPADCIQTTGGGLTGRLAIPWLRFRGWIDADASGNLTLTDNGRLTGESLVRSHRLWEAYLQENFDLPADHLHEPAERIEHFIGPELQERLDRALDSPDRDPHGREIPGR